MKKLILAPAVALAFSGLVAAPVAAAETPSTQSAPTKAEKEQAEKEKAEKEAAEKKAAEKKAAEKKAAEKKAADKKAAEKEEAEKKAADKKAAEKKAADKKAAEDKAAKDKAAKDAKSTPSPSPSDKGAEQPKDEEKPEEINADLSVSAGEVSAEDLANPSKGVTVTVTGLEKGDKLSVSGLTAQAATATGSSKSLRVYYAGDAEDLKSGTKSFSVKVQRAGVSSATLEESVEVQAAPKPESASLVVPSGDIPAEDLADKSKGVTVTVNGLEEGDLLTPLTGLTGEPVTATGSSATMKLYYDGDPAELQDGPLPFSIDLQGANGFDTLEGTVNVAAADDGEVDPIEATLKVDPTEITAEDLVDNTKGIEVTVSGVQAGDIVTDSLTGEKREVSADGDFSFRVYREGNADDVEPGKVRFTVTIEREGTESVTLKGEFTVVDDDAVDPIEASLKVDPKEITAKDLATKEKGVTVTVSGVKAGDKITDSLTGETETAEKDGDYVLHLWYKGNPDNLEPGKVPFTVTIDREGTESVTLKGDITVIDEKPEAPAEASLTVSPKSIEADDFINEKKGVTLSVKDCKPGSDVRFMVMADGNSRITAYDRTVQADKDGKASVSVFGTSSDASAYVGGYSVTATCGDDTMKDSFKVTAGANAGGGGDDGSGGGDNAGGGNGSELPRTGAELDGLAAGALLLLVGGAAVTITMRRRKGDFSPSYV
ncbi:hypothetical protein [Brevibacterium sp. XM4083]|uniref:hypothetical protein n=1 Tax=Brevibacterium sp. XM4083 TaxID=2583238 RepID=UPI0015E8126F|nr:hypothetical protein [Brevibacterium sp. XM4083]MCM1011264.1 hypothetical protein [Brevibacterium sp. XM4083]